VANAAAESRDDELHPSADAEQSAVEFEDPLAERCQLRLVVGLPGAVRAAQDGRLPFDTCPVRFEIVLH
jgi:hypothetical protein